MFTYIITKFVNYFIFSATRGKECIVQGVVDVVEVGTCVTISMSNVQVASKMLK